jgi:NADPH-dependent 2,4-dienoyl-CoA reductase/sulfur reductase-like enzyme
MVEHTCHIAIIGAGPAGLSAARTAASHGKRVLIIDENSAAGGQIWRGEKRSPAPGAAVVLGTRAVGLIAPGRLLIEDSAGPSSVSFEKLILATGARERFLPFPGWTLPGVFGAGGLQALVKSGLPVSNKRVVVAGTGPLLIEVAAFLRGRGAHIIAIAEQASWRSLLQFAAALSHAPSKFAQAVRLISTAAPRLRARTWVAEAHGRQILESVTLTDGRKTWREECDYLACGFHLIPNIELPALLDCRIEDGFVWTDEDQQTSVSGVYCAGEPAGIGGVDKSIVEGEIAGHAAAGHAGDARALHEKRERARRFQSALDSFTRLRPEVKQLAREDTIVCRCEDVPFGRIREFPDWRSAKLLTRCGMGPCQGRVCGGALEAMLGWHASSVRPPVLPARVATLEYTP